MAPTNGEFIPLKLFDFSRIFHENMKNAVGQKNPPTAFFMNSSRIFHGNMYRFTPCRRDIGAWWYILPTTYYCATASGLSIFMCPPKNNGAVQCNIMLKWRALWRLPCFCRFFSSWRRDLFINLFSWKIRETSVKNAKLNFHDINSLSLRQKKQELYASETCHKVFPIYLLIQ